VTRLSLRYDMRVPDFGRASAAELYAAAVEQVAWAEGVGFSSVTLTEHHGVDDGYCPAPYLLGASIAARTSRIRLGVLVLLALREPLNVAEDLAVLDILSNGRVDVTVIGGYVEDEFTMFGRKLSERPARVEEGIAALRQAWTGEPFVYRGREVVVRPTPVQRPGPRIVLGGSSAAAARRAASIADDFSPSMPGLWEVYAEECVRLGRDPGPQPIRSGGPLFLHVSEDPERDWARIAPHAFHEMNSYGRWMSDAGVAGPYSPADDVAALQQSGVYQVVTPEQCLELVHGTGGLNLHPLMGGLSPDIAWESLELLASKVLPRLNEHVPA
jgi:alkanesulfonate monooxygenase SsuD/methylene tetrahydromethanopterin reductase-like flavin-dependent oxidoreductase (luciferase family)